jgi:hypothetical protein
MAWFASGDVGRDKMRHEVALRFKLSRSSIKRLQNAKEICTFHR